MTTKRNRVSLFVALSLLVIVVLLLMVASANDPTNVPTEVYLDEAQVAYAPLACSLVTIVHYDYGEEAGYATPEQALASLTPKFRSEAPSLKVEEANKVVWVWMEQGAKVAELTAEKIAERRWLIWGGKQCTGE